MNTTTMLSKSGLTALDDVRTEKLHAWHRERLAVVYMLSRDFGGIGENTFHSTFVVPIRSSMAIATPTVTQCLMKIVSSILSVASDLLTKSRDNMCASPPPSKSLTIRSPRDCNMG